MTSEVTRTTIDAPARARQYRLRAAGITTGAVALHQLTNKFHVRELVPDPIDDLYGTVGSLVAGAYITAGIRRRTPDMPRSISLGTYQDGHLPMPQQRSQPAIDPGVATRQTEQ